MSIVRSVKTIAKTDLLEEKVGKAQTAADTALVISKTDLAATRTVVYNQVGSAVHGDGSNPPVDPNVYGNNGTVGSSSIPPLPPGAGDNNSLSLKDTYDAVNKYLDKSGGGSSTDLTGGTHSVPKGGSDANELARKGKDDADIQAFNDAINGDPYLTTEEKTAAKNAYLYTKYGDPGQLHVLDAIDSNPPAPIFGLTKPFPYTGDWLGNAKLSGLIGFDGQGGTSDYTGHMKTVLVNLFPEGIDPRPTDADATTDGQGSWIGASNPPVVLDFIEGFFFSTGAGTAHYYSEFTPAIDATILASGAYTFVDWVGNSPSDQATLMPAGNSDQVSLAFHVDSIPPAGPPYGQLHIVIQRCDTHGDDYPPESVTSCAVSPPRETRWPRTGLYSLILNDGKFVGNSYDSEVPLIYRTDTSRVRIKVGDGSSVIDNRFCDVEPSINGGLLVTEVAADGVTINQGMYYNSLGVLTTMVTPETIDRYRL